MLTNKDELKDRINAKTARLKARLAELKADGRHEAIETKNSIQKQLEEVQDYLKEGWEKVSEKGSAKLNEWLDRD